ncbi:MAG: NusG domain II-containing protein [Oscillospiraceae bacterium]|nr:NusG domain II-containing protein [Oscillospiraceae bacterium]
MKKKEVLFLIAAALLAGVVLLALRLTPGGNTAVVYIDGEKARSISLENEGVYHIEAALPVTLEVAEGRIRFVNSQCPDLLCEGFGWIGETNDFAACLPAGVVVLIEEGGNE